MKHITVSVIIPAYNASSTLGRTLKSLASQHYTGVYEVIIVDDGSTDNTAHIVADFPLVKYVYQKNAGPAAARNHGARLASGEYLCFTDSDCIPRPDWISALLRGFFEPDIAVVSGSYGIANPESCLARGIHTEIIFRHKYLLPDFPKAFGSYNICVKKAVFEQVGGFQEGYRQASGEDNDLSYKILASGYRIFFARTALVNHHHTTRVKKYLREQFRHGFWRVKMYTAHPHMVKGDDYTFWKDIVEMPMCVMSCIGLGLMLVNVVSLQAFILFFLSPFLFFEIIFGCITARGIFDGIFFGFVTFFRAFARAFGLSTGIFYFLLKK